MTKALKSSPFQISGGVVQAWRRRRTNKNPCVLYRLPSHITLKNYKHSKTQTKRATRNRNFDQIQQKNYHKTKKKIHAWFFLTLTSHCVKFWPISKYQTLLVLWSFDKNNLTTNRMYWRQALKIYFFLLI